MAEARGASAPFDLPDDLMLALGTNVMVKVMKPATTTSTDLVLAVLRTLDASGYDVVKRRSPKAEQDVVWPGEEGYEDAFDMCPEPTCPLFEKAVMADHAHLSRKAETRPRPSVADVLSPDEDAPEPVRHADRPSTLPGGVLPSRKAEQEDGRG